MKNIVFKFIAFISVLTSISIFSPSYAENTPEKTTASENAYNQLSDQEVHERIHFINAALQGGEPGSRIWYWSFLSLYSAGTIAQLSLYFAAPAIEPIDPIKREYLRQDMMMGTITTGIGTVFLAISPMTSMYARKEYASLPENTLDERVAKLKKAELMLQTSSTWEDENHSLLIHGLNFGLNLTAGLIIWLAFNRTIEAGLITFLPGFIVGEIQLFTQPTKAISDWNHYEARYIQKKQAYYKNDDQLWHIAAAPGGLMIIRQF